MNFREACIEATKQAKAHGVVFFVSDSLTIWDISPGWRPKWLFKVFPGGRNQLSLDGGIVLSLEVYAELKEKENVA